MTEVAASLDPFRVEGHPLHTRTLVVEVLQDAPGRLRAEGVILDLRKLGFVPTGGDLQTAGFIHHMELSVRVDEASRRIEALETRQPTVAFESDPATGGDCCRDPSPRLQALVGQVVDAGYPRRLSEAFGGRLGCSHMLTLAQLVGSTLPRALELEAARAPGARAEGERVAKRALFIEGFERGPGDLLMAAQSTGFLTRPKAEVELPLDRLARQHELRLLAQVDMDALVLRGVQAAERTCEASTLGSAPWRSRDEELAPLAGGPALGGLARRCIGLFGGAPGDGPLLDALLNLAPGLIQCMAAFGGRLVQAFAGGARPSGGIPRELSVGGQVDSCYMWRSDGPMARARAELEARRKR